VCAAVDAHQPGEEIVGGLPAGVDEGRHRLLWSSERLGTLCVGKGLHRYSEDCENEQLLEHLWPRIAALREKKKPDGRSSGGHRR